MNFADAMSRVAEEDERRNDQNRERRQKVRALYSRFKSGLEGSGLKFAGGALDSAHHATNSDNMSRFIS